ncbi:MAG: MarR family transcriptional regulator [Oscillospiraceae bacterium]|nr:MarR family transcriptional regulator [Oscillospiraceae bacterium]
MLINDVSKLFDDSIRRKSVSYPTYEHFGGKKGFGARHILFRLAECRGKGITQSALVKLTHLTAPTVSVALQKMEQQGLIKREQNPEDMRETIVVITEKGEDFHNFIKRSISETQDEMFRGISDDEIEQLRNILLKIKANMTGGNEVI